MSNLETFLTQFKFQVVEQMDSGAALCLCPAHDDKNGDLIIEENADGNIKMYCRHGCSEKAITRAAIWHMEKAPRKLSEVVERPVKWVVPGYIPEGQIVVMGSDGGVGKSTVWANLGAAITTGSSSIFDEAANIPFPLDRKPGKVLFLSGEDTAAEIVKERLQKAGADLSKVYVKDLDDGEALDSLTFDSVELEELIKTIRPSLCVFDPIQQFIPERVRLAERNQMRRCFRSVASLGKKYGTTMLLIAHTNKRETASGRDKLADSADLFDIARGVFMLGYADKKKKVRYISHEKNSFDVRGKTILFTIDACGAHFAGVTDKTQQDFVTERISMARESPAVQEAQEIILQCLEDGKGKEVRVIDAELAAYGISPRTSRRAKEALKADGKITLQAFGFGKDKRWEISKSPRASENLAK